MLLGRASPSTSAAAPPLRKHSPTLGRPGRAGGRVAYGTGRRCLSGCLPPRPPARLLRRPPPFRGWYAGPVGFWQAAWACWRPRGVWHRPPLPEWVLPEMWGSAELADVCIHVPSGAALPGPAHVCPRAMPGTPSRHPRVSAATAAPPAALSSSSLGRKVARIPPRRKGSQKCWRSIPTEPSDRSVRESDQILLGSAHADLKH